MLREVNVLTWKAPSLVLYDNSRVIVRKTSYGTAGKGAVLLCKCSIWLTVWYMR